MGQREVLNENYEKAFENYEKAFSEVEKPFVHHYYTAIQLAMLLNKLEKSKELISKGMQKGISPKMLYNDSLINGFINEKKLKNFVEQQFTKEKLVYEKSINRFLLDTIAKLSFIDNKWKVHYLDSLNNLYFKDSKSTETIYWKKYDSIVTDIVEDKLIPLIEKYGYPGESLIGIHGFADGYDKQSYGLYNGSVKLILLHYFSYPRSCKYNNILLKEVHKGNLLPKEYASFIDFQAQWGNSKYCKVLYYNEWHTTEDSTLFEQINIQREAIGLEPSKELELKKKRGLEICKKIREEKKYKHIKLFQWCG
ncbi:hypothetical protein [Flavobacterium sp.]|uniref:hypothetical protein n=1 Tax=Flavobacterium sp. TaxID=239 RepID=UPI0037BE7759